MKNWPFLYFSCQDPAFTGKYVEKGEGRGKLKQYNFSSENKRLWMNVCIFIVNFNKVFSLVSKFYSGGDPFFMRSVIWIRFRFVNPL